LTAGVSKQGKYGCCIPGSSEHAVNRRSRENMGVAFLEAVNMQLTGGPYASY